MVNRPASQHPHAGRSRCHKRSGTGLRGEQAVVRSTEAGDDKPSHRARDPPRRRPGASGDSVIGEVEGARPCGSLLHNLPPARLLTLAITNAWRRRFCTQATAAAASGSWLSAGLPELGRPRRKMGRAASGHLTPTPSGPFTPADSGGGVISLTQARVNPAVDARFGRASGVNTPHPTHREDSSAYAVTSAWDLH